MKRVLVTGGAGFLGRGLLRRAHDLDWEITVYSRSEERQEKCRKRYPEARYVLGDVRDVERLAAAMVGHDYVVHAAALKHIPQAELNASECISVNVQGALNVMSAARRAGIERVVGISTDKACAPVNVYGCTKMAMERLFADSLQGESEFTCVRYGNVVGSTGSVIPLFEEQAKTLGKVKVTNLDMTRFWLGIDNAVELVQIALEAGVICRPGSILVPIAKAMHLVDVAKAATRDDIEIEVIGDRPGEKHHELLIHYEESVRTVLHHSTTSSPIFELRPSGQQEGELAFTLASHTPQDWMAVEEMRELIADAREV